MNKDQLQQELLKKVKPGIKPSDLKKLWVKNSQILNQGIPTPPPTPPLKPKQENTVISPLENSELTQTDFPGGGIKKQELLEKIKVLEEQNKSLRENVTKLEKPTEKNEEVKPTNFTCSSCTHIFNIELIRLAQKSGKKICRNCTLFMLKRANQLSGKHIVLKIKKSSEQPQPTFTCQTCHQPTQGEPHQVHISNFQEQGINPQQLTSVCSPCLQEKIILANFYCPRTSEGRDTWNPKEPQFDCDCPERERSNP